MSKIKKIIISWVSGITQTWILDTELGISFIIGPNGAGKTTALNLIDCLCQKHMEQAEEYMWFINHIPIKGCEIHLNNNIILKIDNKKSIIVQEQGNKHTYTSLDAYYKDWEMSSKAWSVRPIAKSGLFYTTEEEKNINAIFGSFSETTLERVGEILEKFDFQKKLADISSIMAMSEGELNLIILLATLIQAPNDSIILINKPEIFLHIEWQEELIKIIPSIINKKNKQVIVATHSPNIVVGCLDGIAQRIPS